MKDNNIPKMQSVADFTHSRLIIPVFDPTHHKSDGDQKNLFNHKSNKMSQDVAGE